ncbi:hypothetical protein [Variovorax sp. GT1P44]|uniref:hypothetical protein n=1 Tax=Variovorax sp. GT1P44 TaxID=3443742 RepID=UPI003F44FAF3
MQKKQLITRKPAYWHGQLLLEEDFIDEQQYHSEARYRHSRHLHGFGVASGLEVTHAGDLAVTVSPGFAIDRRGREIELREAETLELHGLPPGALAWVTIGFRTERAAKDGNNDNRIDCYAHLRIATGVDPSDVRLCGVQLDERGRLGLKAVNHQERDTLRSHVAPGSVGAEALDAQLRRDWITVAFHPSAMPQDEDDARPPFRVGATQAIAHKEYDGKPNARGAAGSMAIVLPPGVRHIHRFRVAGSANEKKLTATLIKGGFDAKSMQHLRDEVLTLEHAGGSGGYFETGEIPEAHRSLRDRRRTLSVDIRAHGYVKISMIALEVSY